MREDIKQLEKELKVNSNSTSSFRRKKTSANDERKAAAYVGVAGIFMLIVPVVLMVVSDLSYVFKKFVHWGITLREVCFQSMLMHSLCFMEMDITIPVLPSYFCRIDVNISMRWSTCLPISTRRTIIYNLSSLNNTKITLEIQVLSSHMHKIMTGSNNEISTLPSWWLYVTNTVRFASYLDLYLEIDSEVWLQRNFTTKDMKKNIN